MSEKKRGFLGRLFGGKDKPEAEAPADASPEAEDAPGEAEAGAVEPLPEEPRPEPRAAFEAPAPPEPEAQPLPAAEPEPDAETLPEAVPEAASEPAPSEKKPGFFGRLKAGLSRSTGRLGDGITGIFTKAKLDDETLEELEDLLISADLGAKAASDVTAALAKGRYDKEISDTEVREVLAETVAERLAPYAQALEIDPQKKPHVVLVVGVNGTGKTTTIGKLAHRYSQDGRKVVLAAGDTFRAAAIEQLKIWGERVDAPVVARDLGADAAGLAFDALKMAQEGRADVLLIDTAGRLQNKKGLMEELAKIVRVLRKQDETAPHSVLLVLDATTGQNALSQVEVFREVADVTGLVMTKLDGTARGGILVAVADKFALPIHAIGVGEGIEDFQPFDARDYARALAGLV